MMRIITGSARGTKLDTLAGDATRPTSERAKEALFSMIQFDIEGRNVLDLFAGSGQLALEALSRGAASVDMVDKSKDAVKILAQNAKKTKLEGLCTVWCMDYAEYIRKNAGKKFDIIFIDPPYADGIIGEVLMKLISAGMMKPTSIIICESGTDKIFSGYKHLENEFVLLKQNKYGISYITLLQKV